MIGRLIPLLAALSLPANAGAGAVLEFETSEPGGSTTATSTTRISAEAGSSRIETVAGGEDAVGMIFDGDSNTMTILDHGSREYSVLDEATMRQMASQVGTAMQQMREALENMPPEQRAMAERMMQQRMPQASATQDSTLEETGETDSINGFDCRWYEVRESERKTTELCVTPWNDIDGGEEAAEPMRRMSAFFRDMAKQFSEASGMDIMGRQQNLFEHMQELEGYPVLLRELDDDGGIRSETRLSSAETADVDPALFEPPAGYRETKIGM